MAAECEIDCCGVLAIGRCATCGQAMCESHRALTVEGAPVVNLCVQCQQARAAARAKKGQQEQERLQRAYDDVKAAVQQLKDAGVTQQKIYHATTRQKKAFGGFREIEDPAGHRYGWLVGEYEWYTGGEGGGEIVTAKTFITKKGKLAAALTQGDKPVTCETTFELYYFGSTIGPPSPVRLTSLPGIQRTKADFLEEIADKLRRLAESAA